MKISVITPSFNQAAFIENTICSVMQQLSADFECEHIIMDANSSDGTVSILKKYESALIWKSEPDKGQAHALNKCLERAEGEIIGWLNSDDSYFRNTLKIVSEYFKANPEVEVLYGDAVLLNEAGRITGTYLTERFSLKRLKARCIISQPAAFFRRALIFKHGFLKESLNFCMDYEFWLRLALHDVRFAYLSVPLAGVSIHRNAKSTRCCIQASIEAIDMMRNKLDYIPPSLMVSYSGSMVKSRTGNEYPNPVFIFSVWLNLWQATGKYYCGWARVMAWLRSQIALFEEFFIRVICRLRKMLK